jgi:hypothetical protein
MESINWLLQASGKAVKIRRGRAAVSDHMRACFLARPAQPKIDRKSIESHWPFQWPGRLLPDVISQKTCLPCGFRPDAGSEAMSEPLRESAPE